MQAVQSDSIYTGILAAGDERSESTYPILLFFLENYTTPLVKPVKTSLSMFKLTAV